MRRLSCISPAVVVTGQRHSISQSEPGWRDGLILQAVSLHYGGCIMNMDRWAVPNHGLPVRTETARRFRIGVPPEGPEHYAFHKLVPVNWSQRGVSNWDRKLLPKHHF